jgi:integrase
VGTHYITIFFDPILTQEGIMAGKWYKIGKGLQGRDHESRKYGKRFDRYIRGRYMVDGKFRIIPFGWESDFAKAEQSRIENDGGSIGKRSLFQYATGELERLRANAKKGAGPSTLKEEKALAKEEAKAQAEARAEAEHQQAIADRQAITFSILFHDHYLPYVKAEGKKSWSQELSLFKTWVQKPLGNKSISDISPIDVERVKHAVGRKRSERTVQYCLAIIRRVFNFAIMRDFYNGVNPTKKVKIPSPDNSRARFFTRTQAESLLLKLREKSPQLSQMTEVSLFSGLRWGEVAGLLFPDINIDQKTIFVRDPKNKHSRTVPMPKRLQEMFRTIYKENASGYIFPSKKGDKSKWVSRTVKRTIDDMGLNNGITDSRQKLTFHSCRHSFCSWLAMEGVPLHTIGALAGHRNLKMTQRYSHLLPDTLQAAVSLLDKPSEKADVIPLEANGK